MAGSTMVRFGVPWEKNSVASFRTYPISQISTVDRALRGYTHTHTHHGSVPTTMGVGYMVGSPVHTHTHTHHGSVPTHVGMGMCVG